MKYNQKNKPGKPGTKGFYIALGVCLVAIGVAAWTTYDSVVNYQTEAPSSSAAEQTGKNMSGVTASSAASSEEASSKTESQAPVSSKAPQSSVAPASSAPAKPANTQPQTYQFPAGKTVVQEFSGEDLIFSKTMQDWRAHTGTDFAAKEGDAVVAIADGKVKEIRNDDLYGTTIVAVHGELEVWYCGLTQTDLKKDAELVAGQTLSAVGMVPCESAEDSHFHLMIKKADKWIDPLTILK